MKAIQFILSITASVCAVGMLYGAIVTYSAMRAVSITVMCIICALCAILVSITYKELKSKP